METMAKLTRILDGVVNLTPRELALLSVSVTEMEAKGLNAYGEAFVVQVASWPSQVLSLQPRTRTSTARPT